MEIYTSEEKQIYLNIKIEDQTAALILRQIQDLVDIHGTYTDEPESAIEDVMFFISELSIALDG